MKIKKIVLILLSIALIIAMTGCDSTKKIDENKPTVVCTGFAQYDWVLNILGDEASEWNVIRINDKGADMHSYQPSAEDMIIIDKSDLIIYTGGMSEEWIGDAIQAQGQKGQVYVLLDNCEPLCMEEEHGHYEDEHDEDKQDHHEHSGHSHDEYDEHVWLSLDNAIVYCQDITKMLYDINPSEAYSSNCESYIQKLQELKDDFEKLDWENEKCEMIFADRFPFRYLAEDYGLRWYAAFPGCSAETEASFDTVKELSNKVNVSESTCVFVTETGDDALAKTVISNSGREDIDIIEVNSMQSVPKGETRGYLEIMEDNLKALRMVLS